MAFSAMESFILKPSPSIPNPLHDQITPLTVFDKAAGDFHYPVLLAFRSTMPPNSVLTEGLSRVLAPYPHLAGRITRDARSRPCFVLNNAGARLVETHVSTPLAEKSLIENPESLKNLYPPVRDGMEEMFQVQLNRYACGGMVLGFTYSHTVADGMSMCHFLTRWAEAVRGVSTLTVTAPPPYVDRNSLFVPRNPLVCNYDHGETESKADYNHLLSSISSHSPVENVAIQFPANFVSELKARVPFRCTTFECLLAHLWRKIVEARGHDEEETTRVRIAVNGRGRMRPKVPLDYFGNLVCWALPTSQVGDVVGQGGIGNTVGTIRKSIKQLNDDYFRSFIDFGEILDRREGGNEELMVTAEEWGNLIYPDLEVDSWLGFPVDDIDFGSGGPRAILSPDIPVEGVITFVPSLGDGEKGGVDVYMTLRNKHVDKFRSICFSLD